MTGSARLRSAQPNTASELFVSAGLPADTVAVVRGTVGCHADGPGVTVMDHCSMVAQVLAVLRPGDNELADQVDVLYDPDGFGVLNEQTLKSPGGVVRFVALASTERRVVRILSPLSISVVGTNDDQLVRALAHRGGVSRLAEARGYSDPEALFAEEGRCLFRRKRGSIQIPRIGTIGPELLARRLGMPRHSRRDSLPRVWSRVEQNPRLLALAVN